MTAQLRDLIDPVAGASMRPRLIAVDDGYSADELADKVGLQ